jgi:hypothetical protein
MREQNLDNGDTRFGFLAPGQMRDRPAKSISVSLQQARLEIWSTGARD